MNNRLSFNKSKILADYKLLIKNIKTKASTEKKKELMVLQKDFNKIVCGFYSSLYHRSPYLNIYSKDYYLHPQFKNYDSLKANFINYLYKNCLVTKKNDVYMEKRYCSNNSCQYCFSNDIDAVDHFIEKDKSPELAILPQNLVPVCGKCNSEKNSPKNGPFIYPYYEALKKNDVWGCNVKLNSTSTVDNEIIPTVSFFVNNKYNKKTSPFEFDLIRDFKKQLQKRETFISFSNNSAAYVKGLLTELQTLKHHNQDLGFVLKLFSDKVQFLEKHDYYQFLILNYIIQDLNNQKKLWNQL